MNRDYIMPDPDLDALPPMSKREFNDACLKYLEAMKKPHPAWPRRWLSETVEAEHKRMRKVIDGERPC